jgi:hypothetical protein
MASRHKTCLSVQKICFGMGGRKNRDRVDTAAAQGSGRGRAVFRDGLGITIAQLL